MKQLIIFKTHILNRQIVKEYEKLKQTGYDVIMFVDNTRQILPDRGKTIQKIKKYNTKIKYFCAYPENYYDIGLKLHVEKQKQLTINKRLWHLSDTSIYIIKKIFSDYEYYWQIEYDVFYNGQNYNDYFNLYAQDNSDLIIAYYKIPDRNWNWIKGMQWLYKEEEIRQSFYPIIRLKAEAVDYLYKRRMEIEELFEGLEDNSDYKIPHCELFTATEMFKAGYKINELKNTGYFDLNPITKKMRD